MNTAQATVVSVAAVRGFLVINGLRWLCKMCLHIDNCMYTVQYTAPPPFSPPCLLLSKETRGAPAVSVIRCLSVLEGSSDRLQEAAFMPDDGDHRKQKCLFVPPGLGMSTISRGQYQILPSSSPNTHSCVRSGGILHERRDKQPKAKPHTVVMTTCL